MIEEINEKLIKITKDVADNTQQQVDLMKMKSSIKKAETAMEIAYLEIGKLFFERNTLEIPEVYAKYVDAVRAAKLEILKCKKKIVHIKGLQFCKRCDHKIKDNMIFCPICGVKLSETGESTVTENGERQYYKIIKEEQQTI